MFKAKKEENSSENVIKIKGKEEKNKTKRT